MDNVVVTNNLISGLPEERGWEYKQICVTRVPGYGFGIAVSGGRDNPHFASGDPSIAVSDVLASGPAERILQVNDRIISVNGISLQNVDYATAVQVLRDSGDTVTLVIKRRTTQHQHSHSLSASFSGPPLAALGINPMPAKVTLTKNSKKEDFGIVLGCKLFIKEISSKARDQLLNTNQVLVEGDFITKINNTNCNDMMSLKEAKKIIDSTKDKLQITVSREFGANNICHQAQSSISTTGAVNNFYKGDDFLTPTHQSYSNQNLYVQPPTRNPNLNTSSGGFEDKMIMDPNNSGPNSLQDDKSNLAPRGRSRGPLSEANLNQLENNRNSVAGYGRSKTRDEPPRPPPPRAEDYYSTRRQIYEDDPIVHKKQPIPDARFVTFHKEGSVGIRLTGGNFVGIFVTAVQPGSPASLQGLQPGDKILKVNDMDMTGVTREEAVLFLLSLQDRIELIVQYCKEEYDGIVASQKGDSFYVKTHFHYDSPAKGEMSFRSGDIFHVIDTLYNGVVGCWQVFRMGRNNQEVQKGIIPNKSRAEELATAQFNATKKEMSANESRGSFFRRRRSSNRRSKSLGKEHWDDILFSDTVSKFPAYERVLLKHPGFTRPVILFGPIADVAREKLLKDFPDKFISPQLDSTPEENTKPQKASSNIIRLSAIREVISTGKHALLDITPNAVERLNYAQMYPIVVFFKAETKMVIKQLRQGLPKSAHKSSKKLLEQCQKLDKVWSHVFSSTITLTDNTDNWYRKVRDIIDKQQSAPLWMSESKPEESLSDDFLFPMSSLRLSYASSPESDLEHSPGPPVNSDLSPNASGGGNIIGGRLTKASSDPSVVMADNSTTDVLPPYQPTYDTRYGFNNSSQQNDSLAHQPGSPMSKEPNYTLSNQDLTENLDQQNIYGKSGIYGSQMDTRSDFQQQHKRQASTLHGPYAPGKNHGLGSEQSPRRSPKLEGVYGQVPELPPRIDRAIKPIGLVTTPNKIPNGRSAHERLFGTKPSQHPDNGGEQGPNDNNNFSNKLGSLERSQNSKSDSLSSYDSFNKPSSSSQQRIGPNAHDDLKTTLSKIEPGTVLGSTTSSHSSPSKYAANSNNNSGPPGSRWGEQQQQHHGQNSRHAIAGSKLDLKYGLPPGSTNNNNNSGDILMSASNNNNDNSPRNSREMLTEKDLSSRNHHQMAESMSPRNSAERGENNVYSRYSRSPSKPKMGSGHHMETKTDYGKYSRNNNSTHGMQQDYARTSHQDLSQSHLSIPHHQQLQQQHHQPSPMKNSQPPQTQPNTSMGMSHHGHHNGFDNNGGPMMMGHHGSSHMMMGGGGPPPNGSNHNLQNNNNNMNSNSNGGGGYKPVPPPKPKNYKPPYNSKERGERGGGLPTGQLQPPGLGYGGESVLQPSSGNSNVPSYQHGKSHSNPVDQRAQNMNYYYNMPQHQQQQQLQNPQHNNSWHTETAVRYNPNDVTTMMHGPYDMAPPYESSRRHPSISYASRSEIAPISQLENPYGMDPGGNGSGGDVIALDARPPERTNIVDLQGSREQRGSAFELYRKPVHHNLRGQDDYAAVNTSSSSMYGSQPNIVQRLNAANTSHHSNNHHNNNTPNKKTPTSPKLTKAQSFKHQKSSSPAETTSGGIFSTSSKLLRKLSFKSSSNSSKNREGTPKMSKKLSLKPSLKHSNVALSENHDSPKNCGSPRMQSRDERMRPSKRDITSAMMDCRGGKLVNEYWGVSLEIPENAIPPGEQKEIYFVVSDPRLCDNTDEGPPLDLENGEMMLSPMVMCGPQGTEFLKPVILNIPHYANTLPSLGISLKATDSEQNVHTDWDNILLPSNHAANSVAVKVDHF